MDASGARSNRTDLAGLSNEHWYRSDQPVQGSALETHGTLKRDDQVMFLVGKPHRRISKTTISFFVDPLPSGLRIFVSVATRTVQSATWSAIEMPLPETHTSRRRKL